MRDRFDDENIFSSDIQSQIKNLRSNGLETYNFLNINFLQRSRINVGQHAQYNSNPSSLQKHYSKKDTTSQEHFFNEMKCIGLDDKQKPSNLKMRQVILQGRAQAATLPKNCFTPIFTQPNPEYQQHIQRAKQKNESLLNELQSYFRLGEQYVQQKTAINRKVNGQDFLRVVKISRPDERTFQKDKSLNLDSSQKIFKSFHDKRVLEQPLEDGINSLEPTNKQTYQSYCITPNVNINKLGIHKMGNSFKAPKRNINSLNIGLLNLQEVSQGPSSQIINSDKKRSRQASAIQIQLSTSSKLKFPTITAQSFALFDADDWKMLKKRRARSQRQVASLTKIMTCFAAIKLIERLEIDPEKIYFKVPKLAQKIKGTSANLKQDQIYSLYDLMFGMMLPSGNDAAVLISEGLGLFLYYINNNQRDKIFDDTIYDVEREFEEYKLQHSNLQLEASVGISTQETKDSSETQTLPAKAPRVKRVNLQIIQKIFNELFIEEMNTQVELMGMTQSFFACPHGLANKRNLSCALDIAYLSSEAMKLPLFAKIVSTKVHNYRIKKLVDDSMQDVELMWQNTNRLLDQGYEGIKTGITDVAGPCLAACTTITVKDKPKRLVIVVIRSETQEQRFEDVLKIVNWAKRLLS